jgi:Flp pilus assembly protein TadG
MRGCALVRKRRSCDRSGQALVEFAMTSVIVLMLIFAVVEFGRIVLVYTTIADAARIGARYAITNSTPAGATTAVAAGTINSNVRTVVKSFLAPATVNINAAGLAINTTFPDGVTTVGNRVQVTVSYPYDLLISYYPINITLSSTSQGIITW